MSRHPGATVRDLLVDLYRAATNAAAPGPALAARLQKVELDPARRVWVLALGKAALPMATTAVEVLRSRGRDPLGGLIVAPSEGQSPHPLLDLRR